MVLAKVKSGWLASSRLPALLIGFCFPIQRMGRWLHYSGKLVMNDCLNDLGES